MADVNSLQSQMEKKLNANENSNCAIECTVIRQEALENPPVQESAIQENSGEKPAKDTSEEYQKIQTIFSHHPGLFSFSTAVKSNKNVWCNQCRKETPLAELNDHVKIVGHERYFQERDKTAEEGPDFQEIIDKFPGVFNTSPNNDNNSLWCNACNKETTRANISRHLTAPSHLKNVRKAMKKDVNYENLCIALTDKVFSFLTPNLVFCNICEIQLSDSLTNLQFHIESDQHLKHIKSDASKKKSIQDIVADFGDQVSIVENNRVWCKMCKTNLQPKYSNVERHIACSNHVRNVNIHRDTQQSAAQTSADEFNRDLAQFFAENEIPLKRLATMKDFFIKYIQRHIPDESTLRKKYMNEEERKSTKVYGKPKEEPKAKRKRKKANKKNANDKEENNNDKNPPMESEN